MTVKSIKNANVKGYLKLEIDTGEGFSWFLLSESQYIEAGELLVGDEISEEAFKVITSFEEYNRAKKKALSILGFGDNSERELKMKLRRSGISQSMAESVTREMIRLGYLNEERQLLRLVENEAAREFGPKKILAKLSAKGYSAGKIKSAIKILESEGKINFADIKSRLTANCETPLEKQKLLYKKGF